MEKSHALGLDETKNTSRTNTPSCYSNLEKNTSFYILGIFTNITYVISISKKSGQKSLR